MLTSEIAKRYAQALFMVAKEEGFVDAYLQDLKRCEEVLSLRREVRDFFLNPVFPKREKVALVSRIAEALNLKETTRKFIKLLVEKGRIGHFQEIIKKYQWFIDEERGLLRVQVKTAFPLTEDLFNQLRKTLSHLTGKKVEIEVEEDRNLLGGIVVKIRDTVYDGSIKTQLVNMMKLLGEEM